MNMKRLFLRKTLTEKNPTGKRLTMREKRRKIRQMQEDIICEHLMSQIRPMDVWIANSETVTMPIVWQEDPLPDRFKDVYPDLKSKWPKSKKSL